MDFSLDIGLGLVALLVFCGLTAVIALFLRRVVAPNEVHIVQSGKKTTSYGKDTGNGNSYYAWPAWVPLIGITKTTLPVSVFDVALKDYEAYDQGRVPFVVDVIGFFRIEDTNLAAQRVQTFEQLEQQLTAIVKGAVRTILASHEIDTIMVERSRFGTSFTEQVQEQLKSWGVIPVKNLELMDIRDVAGGQSIQNIMAKKKSLIESDSRIAVALNHQNANVAEINAAQIAKTQEQIAMEAIGVRTAEKDQKIGVANQRSQQAIQEESRVTKEKEMAVTRVAQVQQAEIDRDVKVTNAEQNKRVIVLGAEGALEQQKKNAEAIEVTGLAKAEAEKALQLAPVQAQITLAKEIGSNDAYQRYLVTIRQVEAAQTVGVEQAHALEKANIKIIANTGDPVSGVKSVMDLFSAKGGTSLAAMIEGIAQSEEGEKIVNAVINRRANGAADAH